ncbi:MAG: ImmA/IrrE family metallo-endopeptidase, partial [Spirochaetota bacterium]
ESGDSELDVAGFPLTEMRKRGYFAEFQGSLQELRDHCSEKVIEYLGSVPEGLELEPALLRSTAHVRSSTKTTNPKALWAWQVRVLQEAYAQRLPGEYQRGAVTPEWLRRLAQLSWSDQGPLLAREYVMKAGIHFVVEPHLQRTYLDGAACQTRNGSPVVALTLRYDRKDGFWFTLLHELSHVALHLDHGAEWFVDDLECTDTSTLEREADEMASEALIPTAVWERSAPRSARDVEALARELGISPTIVAGRARYETGEHRMFGKMFRDRIDRKALGWER